MRTHSFLKLNFEEKMFVTEPPDVRKCVKIQFNNLNLFFTLHSEGVLGLGVSFTHVCTIDHCLLVNCGLYNLWKNAFKDNNLDQLIGPE